MSDPLFDEISKKWRAAFDESVKAGLSHAAEVAMTDPQMIDMTRKWRKRGGGRVRVLAVDLSPNYYPVAWYNAEEDVVERCKADGGYLIMNDGDALESYFDLVLDENQS